MVEQVAEAVPGEGVDGDEPAGSDGPGETLEVAHRGVPRGVVDLEGDAVPVEELPRCDAGRFAQVPGPQRPHRPGAPQGPGLGEAPAGGVAEVEHVAARLG